MLIESAARYLDLAYKDRENLVTADVPFVAANLIAALAALANIDVRHDT
jgi:hypothetical protein